MTAASPEEQPESQRISVGMILEEFLAFFSLERGALLTTKLLVTAPGTSIRGYLRGTEQCRQVMTNPLRYLAMATALVTLGYFFFIPRAGFVAEIEQGMQFSQPADEREPEIRAKQEQVLSLLREIEQVSEERLTRDNARRAQNALADTLAGRLGDITLAWMNVLLLVSLPLNAVITFVGFRKAGMNIAEHFVVNAFIQGVQNLTALLFVIPSSLGNFSGVLTGLYMLLSFCFQFIVWRQVYELRGVFWNTVGVCLVLFSAISYLMMQGVFTAAMLWFSM